MRDRAADVVEVAVGGDGELGHGAFDPLSGGLVGEAEVCGDLGDGGAFRVEGADGVLAAGADVRGRGRGCCRRRCGAGRWAASGISTETR